MNEIFFGKTQISLLEKTIHNLHIIIVFYQEIIFDIFLFFRFFLRMQNVILKIENNPNEKNVISMNCVIEKRNDLKNIKK